MKRLRPDVTFFVPNRLLRFKVPHSDADPQEAPRLNRGPLRHLCKTERIVQNEFRHIIHVKDVSYCAPLLAAPLKSNKFTHKLFNRRLLV